MWHTKKNTNRKCVGISLLCCFCMIFLMKQQVMADSGQMYSCTIHPCYSHPVTGLIEDSGGEASYATGQGMVSGVLNSTGMLEVTSEGKYYLTFRVSLMDYTTKHEFWVQKTGDEDWTDTEMKITKTGSDENGATADIRVKVPSQDCVIRGSMYVEPMGRNVIFYLYPNQFEVGKPVDMSATIVTEDDAVTSDKQEEQQGEEEQEAKEEQQAEAENTRANVVAEAKEIVTTDGADIATQKNVEETEERSETTEELNRSKGLSLSTATESEVLEEKTEETSVQSMSVGEWCLVLTISMTVSGVVLLGAGAGIVYYFRKNWWRWGNDDEEE